MVPWRRNDAESSPAGTRSDSTTLQWMFMRNVSTYSVEVVPSTVAPPGSVPSELICLLANFVTLDPIYVMSHDGSISAGLK